MAHDIAKLIFMTDLSNFATVNEIYPARAAIEISALPKGAQIEMDGILAL